MKISKNKNNMKFVNLLGFLSLRSTKKVYRGKRRRNKRKFKKRKKSLGKI
jgi:hypothetical protein